MSAEKILIVDDEHALLRLSQILLQRKGYEITVALSAEEARDELLISQDYSLIVLDLMMPGETGFDFLLWKERQMETIRKIPVIISTAKNLNEDENVFLRFRTKSVMQKGVNFAEMLLAESEIVLHNNKKNIGSVL